MLDNKLRVCYFGTYRAEYSRNRIMIEGLRHAGVEVVECQEQLWHSIEDRVETVEGGWLKITFWKRILLAYFNLLRQYRRVGSYDILIVGYPGQFDVALARILSWFQRKPLVWDVFMSIYLIALERRLEVENHTIIKLLRFWERIACRLPDLLIIDTSEYANWFRDTHGISIARFKLIPTGADDRVFKPIADQLEDQNQFKVVYYGTFIPNHGVADIVVAAQLLSEYKDIHFEMIGDGPDRQHAVEHVKKFELRNISFIEWLDQEALVQHLARMEICLGAFGTTPQSLMTVQNKIYEGLAMQKAVITGDSAAVRQVFTHGVNIYLCERANPEALARAILDLYHDISLRKKIAHNGYLEYQEKYTLEKLGQRYKTHLHSLVDKSS